MAKIRAVVKLPNRNPVVMLIDGTIAGMDGLVRGQCQNIELSQGLVAVVNTASMEYKMEKNARIMGQQLYGPVAIVKHQKKYYESLSDEEAEQIRQMIKTK